MALQHIQLLVKFTSTAAGVDPPSFRFHYLVSGGPPTTADVTAAVNDFKTKFTALPTGASKTATQYLGLTVSRATNACTVTAYDIDGHLDGSRHGSPVYGTAFTCGASATGTPFPAESAAVITLQAPYGTDVEFGPSNTRPRARDRGRVYWGPLDGGELNSDSDSRPIWKPTFMQDLTKLIKNIFVINGTAGVTYTLCVWSRKDEAFKPLALTWVDDEPDVQRRRANKEGTRAPIALP